MRLIADELAFARSPLYDDDLVMSTLNGLEPDFNNFVVAVTTTSRHSPLAFPDLHGLLILHEQLLQGQSNLSSLPSMNSPAAFVVRSGYQGSNPCPHNRYH